MLTATTLQGDGLEVLIGIRAVVLLRRSLTPGVVVARLLGTVGAEVAASPLDTEAEVDVFRLLGRRRGGTADLSLDLLELLEDSGHGERGTRLALLHLFLQLSGLGDELLQLGEDGADAYLAKPFNSDELRALVERQLERHRCLRQRLSEAPSDSKAPLVQLSEAEQRFLNRTDDFIQHALCNKQHIEVNTLAEQLCMSPRQLHRKLVALTGYPPTAYILNHKMLRAKELLESLPELTIEDIAERCGFEHNSSFYHAFKRHYGITPAEYRKDSPAC